MAQLILILSTMIAWAVPSEPLGLEPYALAKIPGNAVFEKTKVGGLSGVFLQEGFLTLQSDDRGQRGPSRFYEATLTIDAPKAELKLTAVRKFSGIPGLGKGAAVIDPEGVVRLPDASLLVTSEADTNRKPREKNRLMKFSPLGKFVAEFAFAPEEQSEPTGKQKNGTLNNAGPEGLTLCGDGTVWTGMERPLVTAQDEFVRFDRWREDKGVFQQDGFRRYEVSPKVKGELFRGVSDLLCLGHDKFLVIERSVIVKKLGIGTEVQLFEADCAASDCTKRLVMDARRDLAKLRGKADPPNYEGLAWGPALPDGRRSILLLSDNNFFAEDTELVVFAVKAGP